MKNLINKKAGTIIKIGVFFLSAMVLCYKETPWPLSFNFRLPVRMFLLTLGYLSLTEVETCGVATAGFLSCYTVMSQDTKCLNCWVFCHEMYTYRSTYLHLVMKD